MGTKLKKTTMNGVEIIDLLCNNIFEVIGNILRIFSYTKWMGVGQDREKKKWKSHVYFR